MKGGVRAGRVFLAAKKMVGYLEVGKREMDLGKHTG